MIVFLKYNIDNVYTCTCIPLTMKYIQYFFRCRYKTDNVTESITHIIETNNITPPPLKLKRLERRGGGVAAFGFAFVDQHYHACRFRRGWGG